MKVSILLCYYERPDMVRTALQSIKNQTYENWELHFVDDSSPTPGEPIVREILADHLDKVKFYHTNDPARMEGNSDGASIFGKFLNQACLESDSDISFLLCDDDALLPDYLEKLVEWYTNNPEEYYSYCHVVLFNPVKLVEEGRRLEDIPITTEWAHGQPAFNLPTERTSAGGRVDSSQVSWRTDAFRVGGARYPYPETWHLDMALFNNLYEIYGPCLFNGIVGQYKGYGHRYGQQH